eukprot:GHVU01015764.1.p1 GENE.GHVU01015764.1~~GHVU01015764.1.p1  ORF type:complete len:231 (-),score=28.83 GHVU01015764.1:321-1013(-)
MKAGVETEIDLQLVEEYQGLVGKLGWAIKTRPDQVVYFSELSRHSLKPTARHLNALKRVLHALKLNPHSLHYRPLTGIPVIVGYSDASFCRKEKSGRLGYKIYMLDGAEKSHAEVNLVGWKTRTISTLVDSSTAAELLALKLLVKQLPRFLNVVERLWGVHPRVQLYVDCEPLYNVIRRERFQEDPLLNMEVRFVADRMTQMGATLDCVGREWQRADSLTKCVWFDARKQ